MSAEPLKYAEHGVVSWPEYEAMRRERDEARTLARLFYHWSLWLDAEMNAAFCVADMKELEALQKDPEARKKYEEWRHVRESHVYYHNPWIGKDPDRQCEP